MRGALVTRLDNDIKSAVEFSEVRQELREMRAEDKALRDKIDGNFSALLDRIDRNHQWLVQNVGKLHGKVDAVTVRLNVLLWMMGALSAVVTLAVTVGDKFHWFREAAPAATVPAAEAKPAASSEPAGR